MDLTVFEAIILGLVQGLTEFIPVSSSGHLVGMREIFGWSDTGGLTFDVALHMGTLAALVIYYWRDWVSIISQFIGKVFKKIPYPNETDDMPASGRHLIPILVACIPAAIVGLLFKDLIEENLRDWYWVAAALVVVGLLMLLAEKVGAKRRGLREMNYFDYIFIGCAQAIALYPGVSRSGITITAGLFRGVSRSAAARFSFLLSMPIVFAAGLFQLKDLAEAGFETFVPMQFAIGFFVSAVVGYAAIRFLIRYLEKHSLGVFVVYRILFALVLSGAALLGNKG